MKYRTLYIWVFDIVFIESCFSGIRLYCACSLVPNVRKKRCIHAVLYLATIGLDNGLSPVRHQAIR